MVWGFVGWGAFDHLEIVAVWIKISELVLPIQDGIWSLETCLQSKSSKDMFQDSDFISKEEVGTPQIRTHVDRVASGVAIVDDNFDNVVVAYDVGVCVLAVNNRIGGLVTGVENSEESRDFGFYVGYVVDCEARVVISHCLLALRAKGGLHTDSD